VTERKSPRAGADVAASAESIRIAAMSDVHYGKTSQGALMSAFAQASEHADVLVLCGDLTDYGLAEEARLLAKDLAASVRVPIVAILGNHDYESGEQDEVKRILVDTGVMVLDGDTCEVQGVGFAGVKGFAGGFGRGALGPWGETIIKQFVREAVDEALKLEAALARLRTQQLIALLHYSPIQGTVEGEPLEIFPFLGCSRLEEPLMRLPVTAVFHGHAHNGALEGRTSTGTPVYNVALPLLRKLEPTGPLFRVIEVPRILEPEQREPEQDDAVIAALSPDTAPRRRSTDRTG
jgi:Icc-related predicted phosphoesterase